MFASNPGDRPGQSQGQSRRGHAFLQDIPLVPSFMDLQPSEGPARPRGRYNALHIQFFAGPAWSGAPPHYHNHAWNGLAHGRKLWLLWPPALAFYSRRPILEFLRKQHDNCCHAFCVVQLRSIFAARLASSALHATLLPCRANTASLLMS